jgi:hypothetical protein
MSDHRTSRVPPKSIQSAVEGILWVRCITWVLLVNLRRGSSYHWTELLERVCNAGTSVLVAGLLFRVVRNKSRLWWGSTHNRDKFRSVTAAGYPYCQSISCRGIRMALVRLLASRLCCSNLGNLPTACYDGLWSFLFCLMNWNDTSTTGRFFHVDETGGGPETMRELERLLLSEHGGASPQRSLTIERCYIGEQQLASIAPRPSKKD